MSNGAGAFLNAIGTAIPANEVHGLFAAYAPRLLQSHRDRRLFERMVQRCGIERRYSVLAPGRAGQLDDAGLYVAGRFADTGARMRVYQARAADLAFAAAVDLDDDLRDITHLLLVSCTGFRGAGRRPRADRAAGAQPSRRADLRRLHGVPRRAQRAPPRRPHRALRAEGAGARDLPRALHAASSGDRGSRAGARVPDLRGRLRGGARDRRAARARGSGARAPRSRSRRPIRSPGGSALTAST